MSPTIRIDDEVYESLKRHAEPFVDTPNSVLRRILGLGIVEGQQDLEAEPATPSSQPLRNVGLPRSASKVPQVNKKGRAKKAATKRTRVPNGSLLPEDQYDVPLLSTLIDHGGAAAFQEVVNGVGEKLGDRLTELDRANLASGGVRWQSRLQFVRLRLIERGLMAKDSPRGVWAITDEGREFVSTNLSGAA